MNKNKNGDSISNIYIENGGYCNLNYTPKGLPGSHIKGATVRN